MFIPLATIVQQCKMLEAPLSTNIIIQHHPSESAAIICSIKKLLLGTDYDLLLSSARTHPSVEPIARITSVVSWRRIWDGALDYGVKGTTCVQAILRKRIRPTFGDLFCHIFSEQTCIYVPVTLPLCVMSHSVISFPKSHHFTCVLQHLLVLN